MSEKFLLELRKKLEEVKLKIAEIEAMIDEQVGGMEIPPDWMIPRIFVWYEIYKRGGIVKKEELHAIGKKYGYDPRGLGGFFAGNEPSLRYVGTRKDTIVLEEWAIKEDEKYIKWIEKQLREEKGE